MWDIGWHWGEWLEPDQNIITMIKISTLSCPETATAYMHYSCKLLAKISEILGYEDNVNKYNEAAQNSKKAYRYAYIRKGIKSSRQCLYVRPLILGLLEKEEEQKVADDLTEFPPSGVSLS